MTNYIIKTVHKKQLADLQTPVSLYLKIRDLYPESALLESSDFHTVENSYSFIGICPIAKFEVDKGIITQSYPDGREEKITVDPAHQVTDCFNKYLHSFRLSDGENPTGINGFFGFTSFDAIQYFENIPVHEKEEALKDIPDMLYIYYRYIIVFNHFKNELSIVENLPEGENSQLDEIVSVLDNRNFASYDFEVKGEEESPITDEEYRQMVDQGVKHCKRGDVFQIVLSRRFSQGFTGDDFKVYRALRSINPSPYLFYFDFGSFRIFGSSPETHLRVQGNRAYIDPIAGTFRRTGDDTKDKELAQALLKDPKENAEHVMLVDLARNDLSRNASEVQLDFYKEIQYYSHVIHMVSRVSGNVLPGTNIIELFANTFPAGTLSGAPKVRAMQLIHDIEKHARGVYGGCIGYVGLNGDLNQAITIRTFLSKNNKLYSQAGAGIVSKSSREAELQEVNNKLGALKKAITLATTLKK